MEEFTCQVCNATATVHMTVIDHGVKSNKHYCAPHLPDSTLAQTMVNGVRGASPEQIIAQGTLSNFLGSVNFIKSQGRMPSSVEELKKGMAMDGKGPTVEITDVKTAKAHVWMERMIQFIQENGRMPQTHAEFPELGEMPS